METFDKISKIHNGLTLLNFSHGLVFAYICAERLFPNYDYFCGRENWGNPDFLKECIDLVGHLAEDTAIEKYSNNLKFKQENILLVTPSSNDFSSVYCTYAMDACVVVYESLSFALYGNLECLKIISKTSIETVYIYITDKLYQKGQENTSDVLIYSSNEMIQEVNFQLQLLNMLHSNLPLKNIVKILGEELKKSNINL
ncbi:MAG: YjaG family protein [Bacteroidia bacterium]|nr:YjaG family protein [Bacteroidia bacterium]